jgi:iron complex transport system substrate-binding protein
MYKSILRVVLPLIMLSLFLLGCSSNQDLSGEELLTIVDQTGADVSIVQPVERVISTYGPATSFIYAVGGGDRLVSASYLGARDPFGAMIMEKIDPKFVEIQGDEYFSQEDFNLEQAATLDPDLIIASSRSVWLESAAQLDIPIFQVYAETEEDLKEAMLLTGQIFGADALDQASAWVAYYDGIVSGVREATDSLSKEQRVRVLFTGTEPLRVASGDMYQTSIIEAAGGISVSEDLSGYWNDVNLEQVAIWDPDVIIVPPYGGASVEAITESAEWQIIEAVQAGHVYRMPKLVVPWDTPAPDSVLGIVWMAQLLNPDLVEFDCKEEATYFYATFYDYDLTNEELTTVCQFGNE